MRPTGVKTARTTAPRRTSETSTPIRSASPAQTPAILRSSGSRTSRLGRGPGRASGRGGARGGTSHGDMIGTGPDARQSGMTPERSRRRFRLVAKGGVIMGRSPDGPPPRNHRSSPSRTGWSAAPTSTSWRASARAWRAGSASTPSWFAWRSDPGPGERRGVLAYLVAWAILPEAAAGMTPAATGASPSTKRSSELALAVGCITLGALLARALGDAVLPRLRRVAGHARGHRHRSGPGAGR